MIEVKNIIKSFEGRTVLNNISAVFETGKTNLIIGRSGSGKTVMIKSIIGLIKPDSGQILYDNRDFTSMGKNELHVIRREMGMLFQGSALFDSMTVLENVLFPLDMFSKETKKEKIARAQFCLDRVNLSEAGNLYPSEISGGMMKRAAIARAIALKPKYLFCDEPNSGLDPKTALLIDDLIHSITIEYQITTVINTHDMNSVMNIGDNIIFIKEGVKEWEGNKDQVMNSTNKALNDFVFASDLFKKVKEAEDKIQNALLSMVKDKDSINKEVFDRARQFVEDERKKLLDQLALTEQEGQAKYDASLKELESQFKTNQEKWLAELFERSINFEAE